MEARSRRARRRAPLPSRPTARAPGTSRKREGSARARLARRCAHAPAISASTLAQVKTAERPHPPLRPRRLSLYNGGSVSSRGTAPPRKDETIKVVGLRRKIAENMAGGEAPHPALHPGRGVRRHRARRNAGDDERRPRLQPQADAAALPDYGDVARRWPNGRCSMPPTTMTRTSSPATARCTWASRRRLRTG